MPLVTLAFFGLWDPSDLYWGIFVVFAVIIGFAAGIWLLFRPGASGITRLLGIILSGGSALYAYTSWG